MPDPKYPDIEVELVNNVDGNSLAIVGAVKKALRRNGVPREEIKQFTDEALSGDYNKVLQTCMAWVDVS